MKDSYAFSPNAPEFQEFVNDPEVESLCRRMDFMDAWEELALPQKILAVLALWAARRGTMGRVLITLIIALTSAALVYMASSSWVVALSVGVLIGFYLGQLYRWPTKPPKPPKR